MKTLIAGSKGMIGSAVTRHLLQQGHQVIRLVRREPGTGEVYWNPDTGQIDKAGIERFDAVIHLATMPWPMRWTSKNKKMIYNNRISTNGLLAKALAECQRKPQVLVCASGMGIYPDSGDQVLTEDSPVGTDFLAHLQCDGEAATEPAVAAGIRVINLRIPGVLGGESLKRNMGRMGSGRQWNSWIGRDELAYIIEFVLMNDSLSGPVNPVSPNPVHNAEFAATLNSILKRKPGLPMPSLFLRIMLGEMAEALILASRRIIPARLLAAGYSFRFPDLGIAMNHELGTVQ